MHAGDILVVGVWAFAIVWLAGILQAGGDLLSALIVFFIAIAVSLAAVAVQNEKSTKE